MSCPSPQIRPCERPRAARDAGQATVEWIGVLILVAVIIAFGVKLGLGSAVAKQVNHEVCTMFSQKGCGAQTTTRPAGPTAGPVTSGPTATVGTDDGTGRTHTGPVIGSGQAVPYLPFGTASVKLCTPKNASGKGDGDGDGDPGDSGGDGDPSGEGDGGGATAGVSLQVCDTVTDSHTNPTLAANCTETEQLSISSNLALVATGSAKTGETGAGASASTGQLATYQLNVTPSQVAAIKAGTGGEPNPLDPSSIPAGDSIVLNQDSYHQLDLSGSYDDLNAALRYQKGHQISSGIKSLGNGEVQVDVGDSQLVQNTLNVGIGGSDLGASVGATEKATSGKEYEVDINTSTPGGWATYQSFLHRGTLPSTADAGVSSPETAQVLSETKQVTAEAHLFGVSVGFNGDPNGFSDIQTKGADGSESNDFQYQLNNVTETIDTSGAPGAGTTTGYQLLLHGASPQDITNYEQVGGGSADPSGGDQNVALSFTPAQLEQLQTDAVARIAFVDKNYTHAGPTTVAGVRAALAKDPHADIGNGDGPGFLNQSLATADGPIGILDLLQAESKGNADGLLEMLEASVNAARLTNPMPVPIKPFPAGIRDCGAAS